jgi:hypothetical protein
MRQALWFGVVVCVAVPGAWAQRSVGAQQQSIGANQSIAAAVFAPVTGEPYQAEKVMRSVQKLSDGTVITLESKGTIARDAEGRMREDLYVVHSGQVNGKEQDSTLQSATVGDPVAHTMLIWTGEAKMVMEMQLPSLPPRKKQVGLGGVMGGLASSPPVAAAGSVSSSSSSAASTAASGADGSVAVGPKVVVAGVDSRVKLKDEVRREQLGQQSMEGVLVTGTRVTTTIPTGKIGNDRPIVVLHEEWRSPELKILVKTVDTDPRSGEQTMVLEGLVRTDPDASLFQAPAGYEVKDMADVMKGLGELGKGKPLAP